MAAGAFVGLIAAVSDTGVIAADGRTPWHYPADLARFAQVTHGSTVVMGRGTYEDIGRPLPYRTNFVVTRRDLPSVRTFRTVDAALEAASGPVWVIGGERIFADAMAYADRIDLTYVPDAIEGEVLAYFPRFDPREWIASPRRVLAADPRLEIQCFSRSLG